MESGNSENSVVDVSKVKKPFWVVRVFHWFMNLITFGKWKKMTPGERAVGVAAWNISSWITIAQMTGGKWVWAKVSPWLVPVAKSAWSKVTVAAAALEKAIV